MEPFESKVRKIGSSFGVLIPKKIMETDHLKEDETIQLVILKKDPKLIDQMFGSAKGKPFKRDHRDRAF